MASQTGYQRLEEITDQEKHFHNTNNNELSSYRSKKRLIFIFVLKIVVVILAFIGLWAILQPLFLSTYIRRKSNHAVGLDCNCGASIDEALSRGCKYDSASTSWLPPHCRDDELLEEFEHSGPLANGAWPYYADKDGNVSLSLAEVAALAEQDGQNNTVWTIYGWHVAHCIYYWKKESRMRESGKGTMERAFFGSVHIGHCTQTMALCSNYWQIDSRLFPGLNTDDFGDDPMMDDGYEE